MDNIPCEPFLCLITFLRGKSASHLSAMNFRGIIGFRAAGGLSPAKMERTKHAEKARRQARFPLSIDGIIPQKSGFVILS